MEPEVMSEMSSVTMLIFESRPNELALAISRRPRAGGGVSRDLHLKSGVHACVRVVFAPINYAMAAVGVPVSPTAPCSDVQRDIYQQLQFFLTWQLAEAFF